MAASPGRLTRQLCVATKRDRGGSDELNRLRCGDVSLRHQRHSRLEAMIAAFAWSKPRRASGSGTIDLRGSDLGVVQSTPSESR